MSKFIIIICFSGGYLYFTSEYEKAKAGSSFLSTPKRINKNKTSLFAPASPALSSKAGVSSSGARRPSLRTTETGMLCEYVLFVWGLTHVCSPYL